MGVGVTDNARNYINFKALGAKITLLTAINLGGEYTC